MPKDLALKEKAFSLIKSNHYFSLIQALEQKKNTLELDISNLTQSSKKSETEIKTEAKNFALHILLDAKSKIQLGFKKSNLVFVNLKLKKTHQAQKSFYVKKSLYLLINYLNNNPSAKMQSPQGMKLQAALNLYESSLKAVKSDVTQELKLPDHHVLVKKMERFLKEVNQYAKNLEKQEKQEKSSSSTASSTKTESFIANTNSSIASRLSPQMRSFLTVAKNRMLSFAFRSKKPQDLEEGLAADKTLIQELFHTHLAEVETNQASRSVTAEELDDLLDAPHPVIDVEDHRSKSEAQLQLPHSPIVRLKSKDMQRPERSADISTSEITPLD